MKQQRRRARDTARGVERGFVFACRVGLALSLAATGTLRAQDATADTHDLPVNWTPPRGAGGRYVAVLMTGDGGFAELVTQLAKGLAEHNVGVVGFNSRAWLSPAKTPDETAAAVTRAMRAALQKYHGDSVVLVGYSRGADIAPFVATRLPADLRSRLGGVVMLGLAPAANFEFHWSDLVKDTERSSDIPTAPELLKLRGTPMVCVYGTDEKTTGCRGAAESVMRVEARTGGHHFDGAPGALSDIVLRLIKVLPDSTQRE